MNICFPNQVPPTGPKGVLSRLDSGSSGQPPAVPPPNFSKIFPKRQKLQKHKEICKDMEHFWRVTGETIFQKIQNKFLFLRPSRLWRFPRQTFDHYAAPNLMFFSPAAPNLIFFFACGAKSDFFLACGAKSDLLLGSKSYFVSPAAPNLILFSRLRLQIQFSFRLRRQIPFVLLARGAKSHQFYHSFLSFS